MLALSPPSPYAVVHARPLRTCEGMRDDLLRPRVEVTADGYRVTRSPRPDLETADLSVLREELAIVRGMAQVGDTVHVVFLDHSMPFQDVIRVLDVASERFADVGVGAGVAR